MNFFIILCGHKLVPKKMLTGVQLACVAAVSFPFPNAREREEKCERVAAISFPFPNAREQEENCERVAAQACSFARPLFARLFNLCAT